MALGATIYKVSLSISDLDRHFYHDFDMTVARHPSETEERMMMRLAAFALHADERLAFTKGIVQEDEPDLWLTDYDGTIRLWIDLGQPDEKRVRKACGRAEAVIIYTYSRRAADAWWRQNGTKLARFGNLQVIQLDTEGDAAAMAERSMQLQALIQDGELLLTDDRDRQLKITRESWV
ncbi:YaeQ family protein [Sulfurimonas sp. HSL1-2]|uniref:YaeQ family protein n=1 Tax=Thiomicrolovo zhangzhouensis TaxID=3131933 RepID=UPI0031F7BE91